MGGNKKVWIVIGLIMLLLGGMSAAVIFMRQRQGVEEAAQSANTDTSASEASGPLAQPGESTSDYTQKGEYVPYDHIELAHASGRKILFFHAEWCPQCRQLDTDIKKQGVPGNTIIFKVDYDTATDLRQAYGVTLQTTFVEVDDKGQLVKKYVAYDTPTLAATLKGLSK